MPKNLKTIIISIFCFIIISITTVICLRIFSGEDNWVCNNGEWIKHGSPDLVKPNMPCGDFKSIEIDNKEESNKGYENDDLKLDTFKENDLLNNKEIIKGKMKGNYFFEGTFPIIVEDLNGNVLGQTTTKITPGWETEDFVKFETEEIIFDNKNKKEGYLIFKNDNPSGLPEYEKTIKIKVKFN